MKKILAIILLLITACVVMSSDVKVTWTHGGSPDTVAGYSIYYGSSSRNYTNFVTTGYVTNVIISNLPPNSIFYFSAVTIGFDNLRTDFGNEIQYTTVSSTNGLPSAVKDFTITKVIQTIY